MADYAEINRVLALNHPTTGLPYDDDDQTAWNELTALNIEAFRVLTSGEFLAWLSFEGRLAGIVSLRNDPVDIIASYAESAYITATREAVNIDLNDPARVQWINELVRVGALSSDDRDSLHALALENTNHASVEGIGNVKPGEITYARSINGS